MSATDRAEVQLSAAQEQAVEETVNGSWDAMDDCWAPGRRTTVVILRDLARKLGEEERERADIMEESAKACAEAGIEHAARADAALSRLAEAEGLLERAMAEHDTSNKLWSDIKAFMYPPAKQPAAEPDRVHIRITEEPGPEPGEQGERCQSCGRRYPEVWWAEHDLFGKVTGRTDGGGLRCMSCFDAEARKQGIYLRWAAENLSAPVPCPASTSAALTGSSTGGSGDTPHVVPSGGRIGTLHAEKQEEPPRS